MQFLIPGALLGFLWYEKSNKKEVTEEEKENKDEVEIVIEEVVVPEAPKKIRTRELLAQQEEAFNRKFLELESEFKNRFDKQESERVAVFKESPIPKKEVIEEAIEPIKVPEPITEVIEKEEPIEVQV